jgi:hypothetical protein
MSNQFFWWSFKYLLCYWYSGCFEFWEFLWQSGTVSYNSDIKDLTCAASILCASLLFVIQGSLPLKPHPKWCIICRNFDIYLFYWNFRPNFEWQFWGIVCRHIVLWLSSLYSQNSTGCNIDTSNLLHTGLVIVCLSGLILEN